MQKLASTLPPELQFTTERAATAVACGLVDNMPAAWLTQLRSAARRATQALETRQTTLSQDDTLCLEWAQYLATISPTSAIYCMHALAPLFLKPDGSHTHSIRHRFAVEILRAAP